MDAMSNYPPLRLAALNALRDLKTQMRVDPEYLDDSPYDDETRDILRDLLMPETVEVAVEKMVNTVEKGQRGRPSKDIKLGEDDQKKIVEGIKKTLEELDTMAASAVETSEKIQVAKTRTTLMDQLLKMQERHTSVQQVGKFIDTVIGILDDLVDEKGREIVMARLEPFR